MKRSLVLLGIAAITLAACDEAMVTRGINSLGDGFVRAFNQDPNDEPIDVSTIELAMTPEIEPFDP